MRRDRFVVAGGQIVGQHLLDDLAVDAGHIADRHEHAYVGKRPHPAELSGLLQQDHLFAASGRANSGCPRRSASDDDDVRLGMGFT